MQKSTIFGVKLKILKQKQDALVLEKVEQSYHNLFSA